MVRASRIVGFDFIGTYKDSVSISIVLGFSYVDT